MSTLGDKIRDRRVQLGMSVDELAQRLNKDRATVYRYENNEIKNVPIDMVGELARALDISPMFLMGWDEKAKPAAQVDDELEEIFESIRRLTPANRAKCLELVRLYLADQDRNGEKQ